VSNEVLIDCAKRELREVDRRCLFWVRLLGVETVSGSGASADDVDWRAFGWAQLRDALDTWLDELDPDALGLVEEADKVMGSFDEGWRAVQGVDVPVFDDPRPED
jgi:hypothetical protein